MEKKKLPLFIYEEIDSTNFEAKRFAKANPGRSAAFLATRQTAGMGSRGRSFSSEKGGLYLSVLLADNLLPKKASIPSLTCFTAVAVCDAIETLSGFRPKIKWVNDLYADGKKIAGILAQGEFDRENLCYAVIGIGVNLKSGILPPELLPIATTLEDACGKTVDPRMLADAIAENLLAGIQNPSSQEVLSTYRRDMFLIGEKVDVLGREDEFRAEVIGVNDDFSLAVRIENGDTENLFYEEVSIRKA